MTCAGYVGCHKEQMICLNIGDETSFYAVFMMNTQCGENEFPLQYFTAMTITTKARRALAEHRQGYCDLVTNLRLLYLN